MSKKSVSLWWPRYVGDYQRKTAALSLMEHGAYALLLDEYYSSGKPLPANASVLQRICRAFAGDEADAVQSVIDKFFVLQPDGYHNEKADEELIKRLDISKKRKIAAIIGHENRDANAHANAPTSTPTSTSTATEYPPTPQVGGELFQPKKNGLKNGRIKKQSWNDASKIVEEHYAKEAFRMDARCESSDGDGIGPIVLNPEGLR
jgi:uncharacterized protein YdaU (DUF1376 family)